MATETAGEAGAGEHMLIDCYRRYIGDLEEVSEVDVFLGAGLAMVGLLLAVAGWGILAYAEATVAIGPRFWTFREVAVIVAGLGVPTFMLGMVTMLVGNDSITAISLAGFAVCMVGVLVFTVAYPHSWNVATGADYLLEGITVYGLGVLGITFAAGAAFSCRVTE